MKRIAVFGGSFDPPHIAHLLVVAYVLAAAPVDGVWVLPVAKHPLGKQPGADFAARLALCRLAFGVLGSQVTVRDDELASSGRTLDLLQRLIQRTPDTAFRLIIGSDILAERQRWHRFETVAELAPPIVLARPGYPVPDELASSALPLPMPEVASSQLRTWLAEGRSCAGWLAEPVAAAIASQGLYRGVGHG